MTEMQRDREKIPVYRITHQIQWPGRPGSGWSQELGNESRHPPITSCLPGTASARSQEIHAQLLQYGNVGVSNCIQTATAKPPARALIGSSTPTSTSSYCIWEDYLGFAKQYTFQNLIWKAQTERSLTQRLTPHMPPTTGAGQAETWSLELNPCLPSGVVVIQLPKPSTLAAENTH